MARPRQETDFYSDGISHPGQDGTNALLFHGLCRKIRTLQCNRRAAFNVLLTSHLFLLHRESYWTPFPCMARMNIMLQ
jgi:hypothetical protein